MLAGAQQFGCHLNRPRSLPCGQRSNPFVVEVDEELGSCERAWPGRNIRFESAHADLQVPARLQAVAAGDHTCREVDAKVRARVPERGGSLPPCRRALT